VLRGSASRDFPLRLLRPDPGRSEAEPRKCAFPGGAWERGERVSGPGDGWMSPPPGPLAFCDQRPPFFSSFLSFFSPPFGGGIGCGFGCGGGGVPAGRGGLGAGCGGWAGGCGAGGGLPPFGGVAGGAGFTGGVFGSPFGGVAGGVFGSVFGGAGG